MSKYKFEPYRRVVTVASHVSVLAGVTHASSGPVLELGAGAYSSPILHWLCGLQGRRLLTIEADADWMKIMDCYASALHEFKLSPTPSEDEQLGESWGMAFVDAKGQEKSKCLMKLHHVPIVVVHDTHPHWLKHYGFAEELPMWKYRLTCKCEPFGNWTTVVSETVDVVAKFGWLLCPGV